MKKLYLGRCSFLLLLTLLFVTAAIFTSNSQPEDTTVMSFEFSLTENEISDTLDIIMQLENYIDNGKNSKIVKSTEILTNKTEYIEHQYSVSQMLYYADLENEAAYEAYVFSENAYFTVAEESLRVLKKLYLSELPSKKKVFEDWTDKELHILKIANEEIFDLEAKQSDLVREYLSFFSDYCRQPYVFLGNQSQDLLTLIHELGHYTAFYHFSNSTLPYDTCEVHSQGNEWLMLCYLDGKFDPQVYEVFSLWRLRYGLDVIVLSTIIDEYEENVYTCESLTSPEQFTSILEGVLEGYNNYEAFITREELYTYSQYVTIEAPVYYLSYATSELASMSLYSVSIQQGYETAQNIYVDLCLKTAVNQIFFDTLTDVGLPNPFEADTVKDIITSFENMASDNMVVPAA